MFPSWERGRETMASKGVTAHSSRPDDPAGLQQPGIWTGEIGQRCHTEASWINGHRVGSPQAEVMFLKGSTVGYAVPQDP